MELTPRQKRRVVIRWMWIPPCAILAWYASLLLGMALNSLATLFCPSDAMIGDFCSAAWFRTVERDIVIGCAGVAALAVVVVSAVTAPMFRVRAAAVAFLVAVAVAFNMVSHTNAYTEFTAAVVGGLLGVFIASRLPQNIEL
jgi:hypothetical protein